MMNRYLNPIDNVNIHFETVIESEPPRNRNIQAVIKHKVQKDEKSKNGLNTDFLVGVNAVISTSSKIPPMQKRGAQDTPL